MIWRVLGVWLVVFAAVLAASWWLGLPLSLAILGGAIFAALAAWDDAFYWLGAWGDGYWRDDDD